MYTVFIRPLLEYAAVVWDSCSQNEVEKLERVQLSAVRIVTGLPLIASNKSFISRQTGNNFQIGGNYLNSLLCTIYTTVAGADSRKGVPGVRPP